MFRCIDNGRVRYNPRRDNPDCFTTFQKDALPALHKDLDGFCDWIRNDRMGYYMHGIHVKKYVELFFAYLELERTDSVSLYRIENKFNIVPRDPGMLIPRAASGFRKKNAPPPLAKPSRPPTWITPADVCRAAAMTKPYVIKPKTRDKEETKAGNRNYNSAPASKECEVEPPVVAAPQRRACPQRVGPTPAPPVDHRDEPEAAGAAVTAEGNDVAAATCRESDPPRKSRSAAPVREEELLAFLQSKYPGVAMNTLHRADFDIVSAYARNISYAALKKRKMSRKLDLAGLRKIYPNVPGLDFQPLAPSTANKKKRTQKKKKVASPPTTYPPRKCALCNITVIHRSWGRHLKSKKHQAAVQKIDAAAAV